MDDQVRFLIIDSYDSFTHNLAALCQKAVPHAQIHIIKNDQLTLPTLVPHLRHFSAIVVGPGPGSPAIPQDIGIVKDLWGTDEEDALPIFGVCLGLQSLVLEHGGLVKRLHTVKHGQLSHIEHRGVDLFHNIDSIRAVRYHSLHVDTTTSHDLEELAWAEDKENGRVVMAVRHKTRPYWAVQYHPESVCTEGGGIQVVSNFWTLARSWLKERGRRTTPWTTEAETQLGPAWPHLSLTTSLLSSTSARTVATSSFALQNHSTIDICEALGVQDESTPFVLLDSAANPGRFSIIGVTSQASERIIYRLGDSFVALSRNSQTTRQDLCSRGIWEWLAGYIHDRRAEGGDPELPFWGGFIGFLTYELGVDSLKIWSEGPPTPRTSQHSDVNFIFVERSVVVDTQTKRIYVQSIIPNDDAWIARTITELQNFRPDSSTPSFISPTASVTLPDKAKYISRINNAKEHLFAGDSYELCLTAQTHIQLSTSPSKPPLPSTWSRYKRLRQTNPAPHSAYIRLHPSTLLSSSPERFLSISRSPNSLCQLRPIKGTVRKAPGITRAIAEQALVGSPKEVAENLMIVDLIRHDLHGVVGKEVDVKQFCAVEEYETVWQLVSVIEGRLKGVMGGACSEVREEKEKETLEMDGQLGWQVLQHSLPPGSMTGAPKKRSVEILQTLEDGERSVYSGVFGYWCVSGKSDWSVTIRTCFKHDDSPTPISTPRTTEEWTVGAGGAITALSDAESEWEEMLIKLQSVLRSFDVTLPEV